jgi:NADH-quinone oxidoreductase subunit M
MVPFHTWLPAAHVEAPTAGSVILAGVLLKMGTYGFLRFSLPITPYAARNCSPLADGLSVVAILYGGLAALAQTDLKKLVAYSSVGHMGFATLGIFSLTKEGLEGATLVMINHGVTTGALFLVVGISTSGCTRASWACGGPGTGDAVHGGVPGRVLPVVDGLSRDEQFHRANSW